MSGEIVLPDTSLCAIVRDEKMNPAGGIERFVHAHIPHVEEAVIVDTGSIDGTREILEQLESKYHNLRVLDHPFKSYAEARNFSLDNARAKYALILDADELLTCERPTNEWEKLLSFYHRRLNLKGNLLRLINGNLFNRCLFDFQHISPNSNSVVSGGHYQRFFVNSSSNRYSCGSFANEFLVGEGFLKEGEPSKTKIRHFIASESARSLKRMDWYYMENPAIAPSSIDGFSKWKKYNPKRDNYF